VYEETNEELFMLQIMLEKNRGSFVKINSQPTNQTEKK
jgi:hypothetical protein